MNVIRIKRACSYTFAHTGRPSCDPCSGLPWWEKSRPQNVEAEVTCGRRQPAGRHGNTRWAPLPGPGHHFKVTGIRSYWPLQISRSLALDRSYWPLIIIIFVVFFCSLLQIWYSSCYTGVQDQADSVFDDILWYLIKHNLHFWTVKTFKLTLGNC